MHGNGNRQEGMFSYISPENSIPADHPLRAICKTANELPQEMSPPSAKLYSDVGRPAIALVRL